MFNSIPYLHFFPLFITSLLENGAELLGEILFWSLEGVYMMANSKEAIISPVGTRMIKIEKITWVGHSKIVNF